VKFKFDKEENETFFVNREQKRNTRILAHLKDRIAHVRRKMSRGASNIFRTIKTRCKWGNKQLWGSKEKNKK